MRIAAVITVLGVLMAGCNKKDNPVPAEEPTPAPPPVASACNPLPPPPEPSGWYDTTYDENKNVNAFIVNPVNHDEFIIVVNGDIQGYNKMYIYNVPAKHPNYLATLGKYLPSVNAKGWIVYSSIDNNIYKIKANGDSAMQITYNNVSHDPRWDRTGQFIYYYQGAYFNAPPQLIKTDAKGTFVDGMPTNIQFTAPFRKSEKVLLMKVTQNLVSIVKRDMVSLDETVVITGTYTVNDDPFFFDNITLDQNDEYFYWSNARGVMRCNLKNLLIDTIFKNCPRAQYLNPIISFNNNELTVCCHSITPLDVNRLYHEYKPIELNTTTRQISEIKILK